MPRALRKSCGRWLRGSAKSRETCSCSPRWLCRSSEAAPHGTSTARFSRYSSGTPCVRWGSNDRSYGPSYRRPNGPQQVSIASCSCTTASTSSPPFLTLRGELSRKPKSAWLGPRIWSSRPRSRCCAASASSTHVPCSCDMASISPTSRAPWIHPHPFRPTLWDFRGQSLASSAWWLSGLIWD